MLLIILALLWIVLLTPMVVRRFRDGGAEKSIEHFHTEHEVLSRQGYVVAPAHRLEQPDDGPYRAPVAQPAAQPAARRPRLTVVQDDDTYRSLETRHSWQEWSESYDFDYEDEPPRVAPSNRYAAAYASVPRQVEAVTYDEPPIRRHSMRARRRMMMTRLALVTVLTSALAFVTGVSLLLDLAVLSWVAVAAYVALALYAISQGYLNETSLGFRFGRSRPLASVEPLYDEYEDDEYGDGPGYEGGYRGGYASEFYDASDAGQWRRESQSRYALG